MIQLRARGRHNVRDIWLDCDGREYIGGWGIDGVTSMILDLCLIGVFFGVALID